MERPDDHFCGQTRFAPVFQSNASPALSGDEELNKMSTTRSIRRSRQNGAYLSLLFPFFILLAFCPLFASAAASHSGACPRRIPFQPSEGESSSSAALSSTTTVPAAASTSTSTLISTSTSAPAATSTKASLNPRWTGTVDPSEETAWVPLEGKVRGVNLGSLFVFEPWMAWTTWSKMGCSLYDSEWPCIEALGLDTLQSKFEEHWGSFYSKDDFEEMVSYGINTVRVPLGYWTVDSLIGEDEHFPRGSMKYVKQVLSWAKEAGLWIILDLHGAPGSQTTGEPFTGHKTTTAGFFNDANYQRAYKCLQNWTRMAHTDEDFANVVAIHVLNEPLKDTTSNLTSVYYPGAQKAIRDTEAALGISCDATSPRDCLSIQFMDDWWGSGNPIKEIDTSDRVAYDDHNYAQWNVPATERTREGYLEYLCTNKRSTDMAPVIVGEWSISTIGGGELELNSTGSAEFFQKFAAAQISAAEKGAGWAFWSWKTQLNSPLWGYKDAVEAGFIPKDLSTLDGSVCDEYN